MKNKCKQLFCLALAILLCLPLVPSAARAAEGDESAYADASVDDIRVKASAADGHIRFGEKGDVDKLEYRDSSNVFVTQTTVSVEDALADVCSKHFAKNVDDTHKNYTFDYIAYVSLSATQGTIYNGYNTEGDTGAGVAGVLKYYYSGSTTTSSNARISDIRFVPKSTFSGDALITYYGYYTYQEKDGVTNDWVQKSSSYAGRLYISVGKQEPGISYSTDGEPARFSADDFSTYSLAVCGRTFRYITFTVPESSKGTLYYNYVDSDVYDYAITNGMRFYRSSTPSVDKVYFVPKSGYSGSFLLHFEGVDNANNSIEGDINITVTAYGPEFASSATFTYNVERGRSVTLDAEAFKEKCKGETGRSLDHIRFGALPAHGTLYNDQSGVSSTKRYVSVGTSYTNPSLIRYSADSDYIGTLTIPFVAYGTNDKSFDGTIAFVIKEGSSNTSAEKDATQLEYTVDPGKRVYFIAGEFVDACYVATGYDLYRIYFDSLPSSYDGTLFRDDDTPITSNTSSSSSSNSSYRYCTKNNLGKVSFLASGDFTGSLTLSFTGYASGYSSSNSRSFSGTITIYSTKKAADAEGDKIGSDAKTLAYYTTGPAVRLSRSDILNVASGALAGTPSEVYLNRPEDTEGSLCEDFVSLSRHAEFDSRRSYTLDELDRISFLPKAGFSGTSRITYTVHDNKNNSFTGNIEFHVSPPTQSRYFNDMAQTQWAIPAVDFFRYYGATTGTSSASFAPDTDMRRGDFILLLSRAFAFPAVEGGSFADVDGSKYYAAAIASAKSLGVLTGDAKSSFHPDDAITRQDAGLYLYRALRLENDINAGSSEGTFLAQFPDAKDTASYAVEAMDALVRDGVFRGYVKSLLPKRTLSRAETITILYRALT